MGLEQREDLLERGQALELTGLLPVTFSLVTVRHAHVRISNSAQSYEKEELGRPGQAPACERWGFPGCPHSRGAPGEQRPCRAAQSPRPSRQPSSSLHSSALRL